MAMLSINGEIKQFIIVGKLLVFGANGAAIFQGCWNGIVKKLQEKFSPFILGIHCHAQETNLVIAALCNLPIVIELESPFMALNYYFIYSSKRHIEYCKSIGWLGWLGSSL